MKNILEVRGLNKSYRNFTLQDVSFSLPEGCRCLLSNYNEEIQPGALKLRPYEAVMFLWEK